MIQAVIFDMDGVLIDSEGDYLEWIIGYAKKRGYDIPKEILKKTIGLSSSMIADFFMDLMGENAGKKFWYEFVEESYTYPFDYQKALNPGVKTLLQKLREHRILTGLASASDPKDIEMMLCANDLEKYFDVVLSGADFVESKPNPEIYLAAAEKLGVLPEACMIIEDSEYGIESGKAAGSTVIAVEDNRFGFEQNRADYLVRNLEEVWDILLVAQKGKKGLSVDANSVRRSSAYVPL